MDGNEETVETTAEYPEPEADGAAPGVLREEGVGARNERFDPTPYMRQLRGRGGGGEYLDVKWRLLWLRKEHPDAEILTEHVQIEPTLAIFKATVTLPSGGKATGYGSETAGDFGDFIEKAETKAIGRALNALGYGAQFGERGDEEPAAPPRFAPRPPAEPSRLPERTARPPARRAPEAVQSAPEVERAVPTPAPVAAMPRPVPGGAGTDPAAAESDAAPDLNLDLDRDGEPTPRSGGDGEAGERPAPPIDLAASRDRHATPSARADDAGRVRTRPDPVAPAGAASGGPAAATATADPDLADYSWTAFWPWARGLGLNGPQAIEGLIGRATAGLSPAQLRELILQARGEG